MPKYNFRFLLTRYDSLVVTADGPDESTAKEKARLIAEKTPPHEWSYCWPPVPIETDEEFETEDEEDEAA